VCVLSAEKPDAFPRARYDEETQTLEYWWESGERRGLTQTVTGTRSMRLTSVKVSAPGREGQITPRRDGVVHLMEMPSRSEMDAATLGLDAMLAASPEELKSWCTGRIILFGNARSDAPDLFEHPRGEKIHGVFTHAAAIDRLLTGRYARLPSALADNAMAASSGVAAAMLFLPIFGGVLRRVAQILLLTAVVIGLALLTYMASGWIIDAPGLVFVVVVTGAAAVGWHLYVRREIGL
jgi:CHASE2 domain-containing sensor protein